MSQARKARLKLAYKMTPPPMGIFAIRNIATGKALIERSSNVEGAINRHRFELRLGQHRNGALMADWRQYGEAGFRFEIVDTIEPSDDPRADVGADLAALLALHLEQCPRRAVRPDSNSYL